MTECACIWQQWDKEKGGAKCIILFAMDIALLMKKII